MSVLLSLACRQARLLAVRDLIAEMWFYTGTYPATPEDTTAETLIAADILATPAGSIGASGAVAILALTVPRVSTVLATGTVGWVRFVDAAGAGIMDLPVVAIGTAGTWPVIASQVDVYSGGELQLLSCVISEA